MGRMCCCNNSEKSRGRSAAAINLLVFMIIIIYGLCKLFVRVTYADVNIGVVIFEG